MKVPVQHLQVIRDDLEKIDDILYNLEKLQETAEAQCSSGLRHIYVVAERSLRRTRNSLREVSRRY